MQFGYPRSVPALWTGCNGVCQHPSGRNRFAGNDFQASAARSAIRAVETRAVTQVTAQSEIQLRIAALRTRCLARERRQIANSVHYCVLISVSITHETVALFCAKRPVPTRRRRRSIIARRTVMTPARAEVSSLCVRRDAEKTLGTRGRLGKGRSKGPFRCKAGTARMP